MATPSPLATLRSLVNSTLQLSPEDLLALDFCFSTVIATLRPGKRSPLWGYLVGPPGCGKTELLLPYNGHSTTFFLSELTANALSSGYDSESGEDPSLLPYLAGKTLVIPDLASIITRDPVLVQGIMGTLRAAFDELYVKASGTSGIRQSSSRFGVIAAVTPVIDTISSVQQNLGERFLLLRMAKAARHRTLDERLAFLNRVQGTLQDKPRWRASFVSAAQKGINSICRRFGALGPGDDIKIESGNRDKLLFLAADLLAHLRTRPIEGMATEPESASRIVQQLLALGEARAIADNRDSWNDDDYALAIRVASDSIPRSTYRVAKVLYKHPRSRAALSILADVEGSILADTLREFLYLGIIEGDNEKFRMSSETSGAIDACGLFSV